MSLGFLLDSEAQVPRGTPKINRQHEDAVGLLDIWVPWLNAPNVADESDIFFNVVDQTRHATSSGGTSHLNDGELFHRPVYDGDPGGANADYLVSGYFPVVGTNPHTLAVWVKWPAGLALIADNDELCSWGGTTGTGGMRIHRLDNTTGRMEMGVDGGSVTGTTDVTADNKWHHLAFVVPGDNCNTIRMYLDGVLEAKTVNDDVTLDTLTEARIVICAQRDLLKSFGGRVGEIRLWNRQVADARLWAMSHQEKWDIYEQEAIIIPFPEVVAVGGVPTNVLRPPRLNYQQNLLTR